MRTVQFGYDELMGWMRVLVLLAFVEACTKPNAAKHCTEGTCTTPAFPFCDVTGAIGGEEGTCIAVTCAAGEFGECRGDKEVRCSDNEHNYDVVVCERGCDPAADGCRLCNPGETACTNGKVATCDADGVVASMTTCPLGCFETQPRCRDIEPSNGLATYLEMVAVPPTLDIADGIVDVDSGELRLQPSGALLDVPSFLVPASSGGVSIRVFVADRVMIQRLTIRSGAGIGPAFALLANGDITISGSLTVEPGVGQSGYPGCSGADGNYGQPCGDATAAGGGGANATNGAAGGAIPSFFLPAMGGVAAGTSALIPLVGGCYGGGVVGPQGAENAAGRGGGALQFSSRTSILVDGVLDARGETGGTDLFSQSLGLIVTGGGAGGGILLEAPEVELGANARVLAAGADGGAGCSTATQQCGLGGRGAHAGIAATAGDDASCLGSTSIRKTTGGGGGGLGRVRINTKDGTYVKSSSVVEDAALTTGTISTR
jgi:hypothetical protein